ncbi:hypothetical protein IRZ80_20580, partial [Flavobacterium sp. HJJ]|nr:hypothetical protein [Flavobacterium sp. HJJ]
TPAAGTGVAPFVYTIVSGTTVNATGASSGIFTGLLPGSYVFEVKDANGCTKQASIQIAPVAPIVATASKISDVACFGGTTGSIRYNVSGFASTYSYTVNGGPVVMGQTASTFTLPNLGQDTYAVVFTDDTTTCAASTSIIITAPASSVSASLFSNVNANCKIPYSVVTINAAGGTPNYKYAFVEDGNIPNVSDYVSSNIANLDPTVSADWDVWVKDANGCTIVMPINVHIVKDATPSISLSVANQCLASGSAFEIIASATLGVLPYTYTINTGVAPSPANKFTVAPGTYAVTVTDKNGCTDTTSITVNDVLTATAVMTKDLDCTGTPDATIKVTVIGGKGPFTYKTSIDGAAYATVVPVTGNSFTYTAPAAITAHTYQFEITDANSCTKVSNIITVNPVVYPVISAVVETQSIKCNGDNAGIIRVDIDATKGVGPFTFSIDGITYQSSNVFTGLIAGTYTVNVKDSKGCINVVPAGITIAEPTLMVIEKTIVPIQCNSGSGISKGSIIINKITDGVSAAGGTGGTAPYTYYVTGINGYNKFEPNNPGISSVTFNVVDFGLYQIRVVDANGCSVIEKDVLVASPPNSLGIIINPTVTCATGGSAVVKITSTFAGSGPFHFNKYTGPGQVWTADGTLGWQGETAAKETLFTNLLPGVTYTFIVYDENTKCYYYETAAIPVPSNTSLVTNNIVPKNITCTGSNDGNVSFDVVNSNAGSIDYTYEIFEAFTNISKYVSGTFSVGGLSTVNIPNIPINLGVGSYYVYVKETSGGNSGCGKASANFNIKESPKILNIAASVIKNENCDNKGTINALAKDGTAPYLYIISNSATAPGLTDPWVTSSTFNNLVAGSYYVHVKDAYNCIQTSTVVDLIKDPSPKIALTVVNKCVAEGNFGIDVSPVATGLDTGLGTGALSISVDGSTFVSIAGLSHTVTGLNSGSHTIKIKDANGCIDSKTIIIDAPLVATPAITSLPTCTDNDGVITMSGTGGTGIYSYSISPAVGTVSGNVISGLPAGTYTVTMTDNATPANCSTTASVTLSVPTPVTFTTTTTPALCVGEASGSITVVLDAANNNPNYTYEITAPITRVAQSSNIFKGLLAGTYSVKVNSGRGCSLLDNNVIVAPANILTATALVTTKLTCGTGNVPQKAIVTVSGSGGTGTYEYSFDGVNYSSQNTYESDSPITVTGYVRDTNGCVASDSKTINTLDPPTQMDIVGTDIYCAPAAKTTSTVTITNIQNGVSPFTYENITSGTSNALGSFSGLT